MTDPIIEQAQALRHAQRDRSDAIAVIRALKVIIDENTECQNALGDLHPRLAMRASQLLSSTYAEVSDWDDDELTLADIVSYLRRGAVGEIQAAAAELIEHQAGVIREQDQALTEARTEIAAALAAVPKDTTLIEPWVGALIVAAGRVAGEV